GRHQLLGASSADICSLYSCLPQLDPCPRRESSWSGQLILLLVGVGGQGHGRRRLHDAGAGRGLAAERQVGEQRDHAAGAVGARRGRADGLGGGEDGGGLGEDEVHQRLHQHEQPHLQQGTVLARHLQLHSDSRAL
uniref:Uncharacterized protein n=1 Tax=Triticum urartu TaxID=4572 RepID=A0A8R7UGA5_TRIUA